MRQMRQIREGIFRKREQNHDEVAGVEGQGKELDCCL